MAVKDRDKTVRNSTFFCLYRMIHKESHRAGEGGAEAPGREAAECSARDTGPESYSLPLRVIGENSSHQIFFYVMGCVCSVRGGSHNLSQRFGTHVSYGKNAFDVGAGTFIGYDIAVGIEIQLAFE